MPSVRLSVRLSVTLADQDHVGWKSRKLIARTIAIHLFPGKHGEILGRLEVGWETRKDRGKVTMEGRL